ncbi:lasso peptide biosynthesis PqqD family chaperone [Metabacillus endolithicus]|uniref:Lasso peptide biosynthesis PqqD family chaperone n=1 Tax=Metabacillus endolithicus TaxID=1535204 RepID=A0ABW5BWR0_9BACI|nr:lasso peptide biosynthesis PqqD family chaperone [Metabacillus endolithicus]UPG64492.1 lasso peptide biosynthesis PqqD family chaperone [Metabacillus endolithicus]
MLKTDQLSLTHIVTQEEGMIVSDMDGEKVMLHIERGSYFNLGEVGGVIWDMIKTPTGVKDVVLSLLEQFEVDEKTCEEQVIDFLNQLEKQNLIKVV